MVYELAVAKFLMMILNWDWEILELIRLMVAEETIGFYPKNDNQTTLDFFVVNMNKNSKNKKQKEEEKTRNLFESMNASKQSNMDWLKGIWYVYELLMPEDNT